MYLWEAASDRTDHDPTLLAVMPIDVAGKAHRASHTPSVFMIFNPPLVLAWEVAEQASP